MSDTIKDEQRAATPTRDGDAPLPRKQRDASPPVSPTEPASESSAAPEGERIAKAVARAGIASRRDAEAMIEAGRVSLNGAVLASPAINVTEADRITIDGEPLPARERTRLWILHKPRGVVTTARDPEGRQTVFDVLPEDLPRVVAIGRLDINTEGLLLLTNDGGLAKVIAHPETGWLRRYRVRAYGEITQPELDKLKRGVTIEGMEYGPIEAGLDRVQGDNLWLTLGLREGKNREVKRILEHLGLSVNRLIRLSFGPFQLGDLEVGLVEEVRTKVLKEQLGKSLSEQAGVDFESPVREPIAAFGKPRKAEQPVARSATPRAGAAPRSAQRERPPMRGGERPGRDSSRPPAPARVPTGGIGPGPRRSTWHAEDAGVRGGGHAPRRGGDPKAAQAAAAERGRERVGAIKTGERRVVVERLSPSPEVPLPEPHRRVKFRKADEQDGRPPRREAGGDSPRQRGRFEDRGTPERRGPRRERVDREERGGGSEGPFRKGPPAPRGERPDRDERGGSQRPFRKDSPPARGERSSGGFRGDKPGGQRPGGGRGFKPAGERGGFKGGKPGGGAGGRPAGRPGGGKPGPRGTRPPRDGR